MLVVENSKKKEDYIKIARAEMVKHRQNLKEILLCTNATPILRQGKIGYMCIYCENEFKEPAELKTHTLETHGNDPEPLRNYFKITKLSDHIIKLDITGLRCMLCDVDIDTLDELVQHLTETHKKIIHMDINNHILPFKFDDDRLTCCICSDVLEKFKLLQSHMNKHYRNYICDECDSGFVNSVRLRWHKKVHKSRKFSCSYCSKIFETHMGMAAHIRTTHTQKNDEFSELKKRDDLKAPIHGIIHKCRACDKSFSTSIKLRDHMKKFHLVERTHKCTECNMAFFTSSALSRHMSTHTGEQQRVSGDSIKSEDSAVLIVVEDSEKKKDHRKVATREMVKHQQNLKEILLCTNATPILRQGRIGYMCMYCKDEFIEPAKLKTHTLEIHSNDLGSIRNYFKNAILSEYIIKLDITGLRCMLCYVYINTLEDLLQHLTDEHKKTIHMDINNHILPFKFDDEQLTCCICSVAFDKFKILLTHMHIHYRNYICEQCDSGFVNRTILTRHKAIHKKGTFPCTYCSKVFDTRVGRVGHIRTVHTHPNAVNRCGYCNQGFRCHQKKVEHLAKVHGIVYKSVKCTACDRSFPTSTKLNAHVKKYHLLQKTHKCSQCDMSFFKSSELTGHMLKHTGIKQYTCDVCFKSYGRKYTLREHLRIHNNDRRFKCEYCAQSFVQKCSWRCHMKSKHGKCA